MTGVPDRNTFESAYAGQPPWDIGRPNKALVDVADRIAGSVLDAGGGTGENALFFAERGVQATFLVRDALTLTDWSERFDNVIDCGLFHGLSDEDRRRYVEGVRAVLRPGGRLFLLCVSDEEPGTHGPRRVSKKELYDAFAGGWIIESIELTGAEVRPDFKEFSFSEGGPKAWFAAIRRAA